ncbi:MAG: ABC transporter ATP-binding protein/permease [Actinomycetota bacterium]|nr:ABC transporter ATP-binding protein/permease [Actinomycetota bacterium]
MPTTTTTHWRALAALLRPDAKRWVVLCALIASTSAGALVGPLIVRQIVDIAANGTTTAAVVRLGVVFLAVAVFTQVLGVVVVNTATRAAWRITNTLRLDITRHVLDLDHEFHRRHTPGELIQRVDGDVTNVSDFLSQVVPKVIGALMMLSGMLAVLAVLDWRLGLGMVVYLVAATILVVSMRHRAVRESSDEMGSYAKLYGGIEERLTATEDLRANGAEAHAMWRFVEDSAEALSSSVRREAAFLRMWWALQTAVTAGTVGTLALSAGLVANGTITLGTAFLLFQYVQLMSRPLEELVQQLETVQKANGAMHRVIDLMALVPTVTDAGTQSPGPGPLTVSSRSVGFAYDDVQRILHDIDVEIAAGRSVGVVGRTGSGKTTFSRLLLRLVEPTHGRLELGGVAVADIPLAELRRRVALVPQEVELFEGTVRDNVTLYDPVPTDAAVEAALRAVGLDVLVDGGIRRPLGSGGAGLSAGQAQLLALARGGVRQPDLVVLDEATARVDPATEQQISQAVAQLMVGRTTFIIAHRLSTLDMVDEVIVFDQGRIVEHGDRADLVRKDSRFRRLLELALAVEHDDLDAGDGPVALVDVIAHPAAPFESAQDRARGGS